MDVSWLFSPNMTLVKPLQLRNAAAPMVVIPLGISMLVKLLQPENAELPMEESWLFSPNMTLVKLLQPSNAEDPMEVTPLGISMLVKLLQP